MSDMGQLEAIIVPCHHLMKYFTFGPPKVVQNVKSDRNLRF